MVDSEDQQNKKPLFKKGELYVGSSSGVGIDPLVGFVRKSATVASGDTEKVLGMLRARGLSEEAIAAFKSGKIIRTQSIETPFGLQATSEDWDGKDKKD